MTISRTFSALSDPTRHRILELLKVQDMSAGEIGKHFDMTAPSLSHHLGILKQAELVVATRQGQEIVYSINLSVFEEVAGEMVTFFKAKNPKPRKNN